MRISEGSRGTHAAFRGRRAEPLVTCIAKKSHGQEQKIKLMDAACWIRYCSSLANLSYAVAVRVGGRESRTTVCSTSRKRRPLPRLSTKTIGDAVEVCRRGNHRGPLFQSSSDRAYLDHVAGIYLALTIRALLPRTGHSGWRWPRDVQVRVSDNRSFGERIRARSLRRQLSRLPSRFQICGVSPLLIIFGSAEWAVLPWVVADA